jgi:hypothetical protein
MPDRNCLPCLLSAAFLAAVPAFAHTGDFILAKAAPIPGGGLLLEVTADYGNNPLFSTEEEAREAIRHCLQIESRGTQLPLETVAPFVFEKRSEPDPDCPLPKTGADTEETHWLLTGRWQGRPESPQALFSAPKQSPHSVVLWTAPEPGKPTRWAMLLGGDQAPPIVLSSPPRALPGLPAVAGAGCVLLAVVGGLRRLCPVRSQQKSCP